MCDRDQRDLLRAQLLLLNGNAVDGLTSTSDYKVPTKKSKGYNRSDCASNYTYRVIGTVRNIPSMDATFQSHSRIERGRGSPLPNPTALLYVSLKWKTSLPYWTGGRLLRACNGNGEQRAAFNSPGGQSKRGVIFLLMAWDPSPTQPRARTAFSELVGI